MEKTRLKWKLRALDAGLAVYPIATKGRPSRDGVFIKWDDIDKVVAYKRDLLTEDLVCIKIIDGKNDSIEINEEIEGFHDALRDLPSYLKGFPNEKEYWGALIQPAFLTNETTLWRK